MRMAMELLDEIIESQPVDRKRIYVTGLSMGGFGTWDIIQRQPKVFAAAMPVCGGGDPAFAKKLKKLSLWAFHGDSDTVVKTQRSRDMIDAIRKKGGNPLYTEYKNTKHNAWEPTYSDNTVLNWLFEQRR
jgi:predicted peptidase